MGFVALGRVPFGTLRATPDADTSDIFCIYENTTERNTKIASRRAKWHDLSEQNSQRSLSPRLLQEPTIARPSIFLGVLMVGPLNSMLEVPTVDNLQQCFCKCGPRAAEPRHAVAPL
jgi:hypothetical protein